MSKREHTEGLDIAVALLVNDKKERLASCHRPVGSRTAKFGPDSREPPRCKSWASFGSPTRVADAPRTSALPSPSSAMSIFHAYDAGQAPLVGQIWKAVVDSKPGAGNAAPSHAVDAAKEQAAPPPRPKKKHAGAVLFRGAGGARML